MALCVVGFDAYFLNNPTQCFFSNDCTSYSYSYNYYYSNYTSTYDNYGLSDTTTLYNIKVPLIKGQLAAAVLMFVSSVIFIIIFAVTSCLVSKNTQLSSSGPSVPIAVVAAPTQYAPPFMNPTYSATTSINPVKQPSVNPPVVPAYAAPVEAHPVADPPRNQLVCPNCRSRFQVAAQQP